MSAMANDATSATARSVACEEKKGGWEGRQECVSEHGRKIAMYRQRRNRWREGGREGRREEAA